MDQHVEADHGYPPLPHRRGRRTAGRRGRGRRLAALVIGVVTVSMVTWMTLDAPTATDGRFGTPPRTAAAQVPTSPGPSPGFDSGSGPIEPRRVVIVAVEGQLVEFDQEVVCAIGPTGEGTVRATAGDGHHIAAELGGTGPAVTISEHGVIQVAPVTSTSSDGRLLYLAASSAGIELALDLAICRRSV